jgi:hypothetical protein
MAPRLRSDRPAGPRPSRRAPGILAAGLFLVLLAAPLLLRHPGVAGAQTGLPRRAVFANTAADGLPTYLPPPDPSYCQPAGGPGSTPPNSVLGTLTIGGQPAPVGTVVQVLFGGVTGPASATSQPGGYRVDYAAGTAGCPNQVGAAIAIRVNGSVFPSGVKVGDEAANPFLRFDIAVP